MTTQNEQSTSKIQTQQLELPKGGGSMQGIGETFQPNSFSGTGGYTIPIPVSPARGFGPQLALQYNSGAGNSEFGLGFTLILPKISIRTEKGLPRYDDSDTYIADTGELVPKFKEPYFIDGYEVQEYLPRIEGGFACIQHFTKVNSGRSYWKITANDGTVMLYGKSTDARIADEQDPSHIFEWLLESAIDSQGNKIHYAYQQEDDAGIKPNMVWEEGRATTQKYIKNIQYGNYQSGQDEKFAFEIVFDYGEYDLTGLDKEDHQDPYTPSMEWNYRPDAFSSYKSTFEIRTRRLCQNILLFHHFEEELGAPYLVKSLALHHTSTDQSQLSTLSSVVLTGYARNGKDAKDPYQIQAMPATAFTFSTFNPPAEPVFDTLEIKNNKAPGYLDTSGFQPIDFNGEGIAGLLYNDDTSLLYFEPLGGGEYAAAETLDSFPINRDFQSGQTTLVDLEGNGELELVVTNASQTGFYQKKEADYWENFKTFEAYPNDYTNPAMEMAGLSNNGKTDMLLVKQNDLLRYPSLGKKGYAAPEIIPSPEDFPIKRAQKKTFVGFANLLGDGLSHRVKITNGHVACWPDLGYGHFGEKVILGTAPDFGDQFDASRLFLADIDGSGTADLVYVHSDSMDLYVNRSGNSFSEAITVTLPEAYSSIDQISFADILGNGTTCLVFTKIAIKPRHYYYNFTGENIVDAKPVKSLKPYLLNRIDNNMGGLTEIQYCSSTKFYLEDKKAGKPWITKLPFPVQLVEKTIITDQITNSRYTQLYKYHDGYYDHIEKTFKGFGYVETWDTESYEELHEHGQDLNKKNYVPPVYTRTWYNTGALPEDNPIYDYYQSQFFQGDTDAYHFPGSELKNNIYAQGPETLRQGYIALSGQVIRSEVYGLDGRPEAATPYTVSQSNFTVSLYQEKADNEYAVFMVTPRESIAYQYERYAQDPRIQQSFSLEVDSYGNVLQAVTVMLPRRTNVEGSVYPEQQQLYATLTQNTFVQPLEENRYCHVGCEQQNLELNGLDLQGNDYFSFDQIKSQVSTIGLPDDRQNIIPYGGDFTEGVQARQVTWERQYFWDEAQTDSLNLGKIAYNALLHHQETAVFPKNFVHEVFTSRLTDDTITSQGGYFFNEVDGYWWNRGLVQYYLGAEGFYLPSKTENSFVEKSSPLFAQTTITYNVPYYFSAIETSQYIDENIQSVAKATVDYRTQQAKQLTDPNNNTTQALFDPLGKVIVTTLFGTESGQSTGNMTLYAEDGNPPDYILPDAPTFDDMINNPNTYYLQGASTYFYYNLKAWQEDSQPVCSISLTRNNYWNSPDKDKEPYCQTAISYSDGLGRDLEQKIQVEPVDGKDWQVSGRTVYNNKGKAFEQYLPYFSAIPEYEEQQELEGPPPTVTHYDPLERVIRVDTPKGFFSKVEFTSWEEQHYDEDDTMCDSAYYQAFMAITEPLTPRQQDEKDALDKAAVFYDTPDSKLLDSVGQVFHAMQILKASDPIPPLEEQTLTSYYEYDILGRVIRSIDPRLYRSNAEEGTDYYNFKYVYPMGAEDPALTDSVDGGITRNLNNIFGAQLWTLSARSYCQLITYDHVQRQTTLLMKKMEEDAPVTSYDDFNLVEQFTYGDQLDQSKEELQAYNLWGALYQLNDLSGIVKTSNYSMQGQLLYTSRQMTQTYNKNINWREEVPMEERDYPVAYTYNAAGQLISETTPDDSITTHSYNQQGALKTVKLALSGSGSQDIVDDIQYDAQWQRSSIDYSNGVRTKYTYEDTTLNLIKIKSTRQADHKVIQDLDYTYDPVGNITRTRDNTSETVFHKNQQIDPLSDYTYDALYRLTKATGRQHPGIPANTFKNKATEGNFKQSMYSQLPSLNEAEVLENYTEQYTYDGSGNLVTKQHSALSGNWTIDTSALDNCNRLEGRDYDAAGNLRQLHRERGLDLSFNCCENLVKAIVIPRPQTEDDAEYYNYDSGEQRTRKVFQFQANGQTHTEDKIYVGNYEIKRKKTGAGPDATVTFERQTLRVMDDTTCVAIIHSITQDDLHPEKEGTSQCRFQLGNNLGSVSVELDPQAQLISYEEYFPYGGTAIIAGENAAEVATKEYRYSGKERDDTTGLYYYGFRYYASWLGTWLKPDPAGTVDGLNVYAFVTNNPIRLNDKEGLSSGPPSSLTMNDEYDMSERERKYTEMAKKHNGKLVAWTSQTEESRRNQMSEGGVCCAATHEWTKRILSKDLEGFVRMFKEEIPESIVKRQNEINGIKNSIAGYAEKMSAGILEAEKMQDKSAIRERINAIEKDGNETEKLKKTINSISVTRRWQNTEGKQVKLKEKLDAEQVIKELIDEKNKVIQLNMFPDGEEKGHVVGVYNENDNGFHFFDVNSGAFQFDTKDGFKGFIEEYWPNFYRDDRLYALFGRRPTYYSQSVIEFE